MAPPPTASRPEASPSSVASLARTSIPTTRSPGSTGPPVSPTRVARASSSRPTSRSPSSGASSPPTSWSASTSTARSTPPSASPASATWSTGSSPRSPTGAERTATSPRRPTTPTFYDELTPLLLHQYGSSTRRSGSTSASKQKPQGSACFIQSVQRQHGRHHGARPQRGHALQVRLGHRHRPLDAPLQQGEARRRRHALGPGQLHAGLRRDRQRRQVGRQDPPRRQDADLKVWHPDILEFIECKTKEEKKAQALIDAGLRGQLQRRGLQLGHVPERQPLGPRHRRLPAGRRGRRASGPPARSPTGRPMETYPARDADGQDRRGDLALRRPRRAVRRHDPRWHTCPNTAPINASNPCSEYMFLDDSACNLASLNLMKFRREDGTFDAERFRAACGSSSRRRRSWSTTPATRPSGSRRTATSSARSGWATPTSAACSWPSGLPYDSDEGRGFAGRAITAIMHGQAYLTQSASIAGDTAARSTGSPQNREPMLRVMEMHRDAVEAIDPRACRRTCARTRKAVWDECLEPAGRTATATPRSPCSRRPARSPS